MLKGKIGNIEEKRKIEKANKSTEPLNKQEKLQLHLHAKIKVC